MDGPWLVFGIMVAMVALFMWGRAPNALVALGAALSLWASGILSLRDAIAGFGDPTVLFIASLLVVSAGLEASGVAATVGQKLVAWGGESRRRLLGVMMLLGGTLTALIGKNGVVSALLPVVTLLSVRLGRPPSSLLMPLAYATHGGALLLLTASLINIIVSDALADAGLAPLGFFELSLVGVVLLLGTVGLLLLLSERLLPERAAPSLPEDLTRHSGLLAEQYNLFDSAHRYALTAASPLVGSWQGALASERMPGVSVIGVQSADGLGNAAQTLLVPGDVLILRGDGAAVGAFAEAKRLEPVAAAPETELRGALFNAVAGFAELVVPPRSRVIGRAVFPGMVRQKGDIVLLAIQRHGRTVEEDEVALAAGDTLLVQGSWAALAELDESPDVLVVDSAELVRRQSPFLGAEAWRALGALGLMVALLASGLVPVVIAGLVAAIAVVLLGVLRIDQAFRAIDGTTIVMVASLLPLATALRDTGGADLLAEALISVVGQAGPQALLAGVFVLTAGLCQLVSGVATALIVIPIALAASAETGVSARPMLVVVAIAAGACFVTPISASVNVMVKGPAGYVFADFARLGAPLLLWFFVVSVGLVPLIWPL
jgi:di/tricarboxylate transporter